MKRNSEQNGYIPGEDEQYNKLLESIYKDNYPYFYKIAYSILRNDADAKDAINESFLKSYKYMDTISKIECPKIRAYFVCIIKSISINIKKRRNKYILSEFSDKLIDKLSFSEGADIAFEKAIRNESLYSLLGELSVIEQNILEYKIIDRMKFKEIAKIIGISEEAARKRYQRILKKLNERGKRE